MLFKNAYEKFWEEMGESKKVVLATSLNDKVTSRMVNAIIFNKKIYVQTNSHSRKYEQMKRNKNVSLCIENIQIDGECKEIGSPLENQNFTELYKKYFTKDFARYSISENERLFEIEIKFIQRCLEINGTPFMEVFDVTNGTYSLNRYINY